MLSHVNETIKLTEYCKVTIERKLKMGKIAQKW